MSMNAERVSLLLDIVEGATGHGGKLASISAAALNELFDINAELRKEQMAKAASLTQAQAQATPPLENEHDISNDLNVRRDADTNLTERRV